VPAGTPVFVGPGLPPGRATVGAVVIAGFTGAGVERRGGAAARFAADVVDTGSWARSARASVERAADAEALVDADALPEPICEADGEVLALLEAEPELVAGLDGLISCPLGDAETTAPVSAEGPFDEVRATPAKVPTATAAMATTQTGLLKRTACTRELLAFGTALPSVYRPFATRTGPSGLTIAGSLAEINSRLTRRKIACSVAGARFAYFE